MGLTSSPALSLLLIAVSAGVRVVGSPEWDLPGESTTYERNVVFPHFSSPTRRILMTSASILTLDPDLDSAEDHPSTVLALPRLDVYTGFK